MSASVVYSETFGHGYTLVSGGPTGYSILRVITDHDQAVRAFTLLGDSSGFVSVANDGTAKLRALDGSVIQTFINPVSNENKPFFCFGVGARAIPGCFATCNEDLSVRIYSPDGLVSEVLHPGEWSDGIVLEVLLHPGEWSLSALDPESHPCKKGLVTMYISDL